MYFTQRLLRRITLRAELGGLSNQLSGSLHESEGLACSQIDRRVFDSLAMPRMHRVGTCTRINVMKLVSARNRNLACFCLFELTYQTIDKRGYLWPNSMYLRLA